MTTNQTPDLDSRSPLENGFTEETARKLYEQGEEIVIFALLHLDHHATNCPDCGEKLRKRKDVRKSFDRYSVEKLSNCGRERVNINGAVDIDTLETVTDFADSINSQSTIRLFKKLEANHAETEVIHLIVDNATYYKSRLVKEYLKHSIVVLHYLPGYSPNLNLIERLWKFFKKKILYNKYYEKYEDFYRRVKVSSAVGRSTGKNCARSSPKTFTVIKTIKRNSKPTTVYQ